MASVMTEHVKKLPIRLLPESHSLYMNSLGHRNVCAASLSWEMCLCNISQHVSCVCVHGAVIES